MRPAVRSARAPRDYRSVGIMLDTAHKPWRGRFTLTVGLWWRDIEVSW